MGEGEGGHLKRKKITQKVRNGENTDTHSRDISRIYIRMSSGQSPQILNRSSQNFRARPTLTPLTILNPPHGHASVGVRVVI